MHRLRSRSTIYRFRFAALLLCFKCLLTPASAGVLVYSFVINDDQLTLIGLIMALVAICLVIAQWIVAARTNCPLCMTAVMAEKRCTKHRMSRTVCGSHRLRVALAILFRGSFRCPYCHEPTAMEVRVRKHR
jgi:hypothetical protein